MGHTLYHSTCSKHGLNDDDVFGQPEATHYWQTVDMVGRSLVMTDPQVLWWVFIVAPYATKRQGFKDAMEGSSNQMESS